MKYICTILAALLLAAAPAQAQTLKSFMFNSANGQVVANTGTNVLTFTNANMAFQNSLTFQDDVSGIAFEASVGSNSTRFDDSGISFDGVAAANTRTNLGLGATNDVTLNSVAVGGFVDNPASAFIADSGGMEEVHYGVQGITYYSQYDIDAEINIWNKTFYSSVTTNPWTFYNPINFNNPTNAATTRTNLSLGATNIVTFAGVTNNGDITINQTTASNGLLYVRRTNNEAFLGLANLIASNNTTLSNETLFRVGRAEATNQSAQFGFRIVRTNNGGEGLAVFSVFGFNALMMIGPSDRSRTNTATNAGIEADIWTINQTNRVMTLRDTNSGALTLHQDLGFGAGLTNTAPSNTNTPAVWMRVWVGTNNYRLPLYQ